MNKELTNGSVLKLYPYKPKQFLISKQNRDVFSGCRPWWRQLESSQLDLRSCVLASHWPLAALKLSVFLWGQVLVCWVWPKPRHCYFMNQIVHLAWIIISILIFFYRASNIVSFLHVLCTFYEVHRYTHEATYVQVFRHWAGRPG